MTIRKTITVIDAMRLTGFPRSTIYRLVRTGQVQYLKGDAQASRIRIFEDSLGAWMAAHAKGERVSTIESAVDPDAALPAVDSPFL